MTHQKTAIETRRNLAIAHLLDPYDSSPTECDGMTQICHTVLHKEGIPHQVMFGVCRHGIKLLPIHFWINLESGMRVDYRLRMWFGTKTKIPHGIFDPAQFPAIEYEGVSVDLPPLSSAIFQALLIGISDVEPVDFKSLKGALAPLLESAIAQTKGASA